MHKWYDGKRRDFEQRTDLEIAVLFLQGIEYFLSKQEIVNAIRVLHYMMNNLGGQMRRRGEENNSWKGWYSDECKKGKENAMKAINNGTRKRYEIVEAKQNYTRKQWRVKEKYGRIKMRIT
jgi:hypothetical protein